MTGATDRRTLTPTRLDAFRTEHSTKGTNMSVLDRDGLEASPLADLHEIAKEVGLDGFRRLRKADLIDSILERVGGDAGSSSEDADSDEADDKPKPRARRPRRTADPDDAEATDSDPDVETEAEADAAADTDTDTDSDDAPARPRRRRGGRGRRRSADPGDSAAETEEDDDTADAPKPARGRGGAGPSDGKPGPERSVEGTVELLSNGSGFVRVEPPEASEQDVYVSAAQVRRCELVSGDVVSGPVRAPRRSERFASLVRVETINGRPADEVAEGTRWDELAVAFPSARLALGSDDPTLKAIEWLTPIGKGSRVVLIGPTRSGKSEALRRMAAALGGVEGVEVTLVLAGTRPEEAAEWSAGDLAPATVAPLGTSPDAQAHAVEHAIDQARRVAARGGDAVVLIDSLEHVPPPAARRALASARNLAESGSLTVIAVAPAPFGGETTVIAFDAQLAQARRFPAIDLRASGTLRPELLVGDAGAEAIARARAEAVGIK
jgi:transcription termination factor Rho